MIILFYEVDVAGFPWWIVVRDKITDIVSSNMGKSVFFFKYMTVISFVGENALIVCLESTIIVHYGHQSHTTELLNRTFPLDKCMPRQDSPQLDYGVRRCIHSTELPGIHVLWPTPPTCFAMLHGLVLGLLSPGHALLNYTWPPLWHSQPGGSKFPNLNCLGHSMDVCLPDPLHLMPWDW